MVTKAAIAESILNLTRLDEIYRSHDSCIKTATLWLALASLCVLDKDHVERYANCHFLHFKSPSLVYIQSLTLLIFPISINHHTIFQLYSIVTKQH